MVKKIEKDNKIFFQCQECGFLYKTKEWAKKCEAWCKKHNSCNMKITKHAVKNRK